MSDLAATLKFCFWLASLAILFCTSPPEESLTAVHLLHFLVPLWLGSIIDLAESGDEE